MNPEACCSSSSCYSSLQRTVRNYSRLSFAIRILSKLLPSFFCHNEGFFRKPTSPPLPLMRDFFLKSPRPSLPLKRAPPLISVFSPQGRRGNRSSSSLVTISFYGWRTIRGLASSRAAVCGMRPHGYKSLTGCLVLARCLLGTCSKFFRKSTWISLVLMTEVLPSRPVLL